MAITTEADPTPMVLGIAAALRRSESLKPSLIAGMKGVAADEALLAALPAGP
jgi:hypothetical protein